MKQSQHPYRKYGQFFSIVVQMAVLIFLGVYGGQKLDAHFSSRYFIIIGSLLGVGLALYVMIRSVGGNKE